MTFDTKTSGMVVVNYTQRLAGFISSAIGPLPVEEKFQTLKPLSGSVGACRGGCWGLLGLLGLGGLVQRRGFLSAP